MKKKHSETDQLTGHFQSFFIYFFLSPDPKSEFFSRKSTNKKFWPYEHSHSHWPMKENLAWANKNENGPWQCRKL